MASLFSSFTANPSVFITLNGIEDRKKRLVKVPGAAAQELPIYTGNENIQGKIDVICPAGKKIDHMGIKVEMIGHIGEIVFFLFFTT
jgi:vacuolar protein sorting-associated protein 26